MAEKQAPISEDLDKIQQGAQGATMQNQPGLAYLGKSITLQHGDGYQYPIDTFVRQIVVEEDMNNEGIFGYLQMIDTYNLIRNGIILLSLIHI